MVTLVLLVCFACPLADLFDSWDHTLQTGNDTEYALVVLALCIGAAFLLKRFIPQIAVPSSPITGGRFFLVNPLSSALMHLPAIVLVPASPPSTALRI
jgi:hypothetical protein